MSTQRFTKQIMLACFLIIIGAVITANAIVTDSKLFFVPLFLLGLLGWIRFASRYPAAALIIIIFLAEECFDMYTFGIRQRFLSDIAIALMTPIIVLNLRKIWNHITRVRSPYTLAILLFFTAILVSIYFGSYSTFGQPIAVGLTVSRKYLLFLSYFFLVAVDANREECYRFLKYLAWLGAAIAVLSIVEVALGGGVIFSQYYAVGQERAGLLRIHIGTFLIVYSIIYSFIRLQYLHKGNKQRLTYQLLIGLGLFTLGFIVMTRAVIIGLAITLILWITRKITSPRIIFVCATISIVALIILSGIGNTILSETFVGEIINQTTTELGSDKGNISIRQKGAEYYLNLMLDNALLTGVGIFSDTNYPNNPVTQGATLYHYYLIDNNGITTVIHFGLQGLIVLVFFIIKSLHDSNTAMRHVPITEKHNYEILFFLFIYTLLTPTLNNILVERMLIYSGVFFYLLSLSCTDKHEISTRKP